jgi:phosphatidylglycerophosphate synthase
MSEIEQPNLSAAAQRPWDARLARRLVAPLKDSWVAPNHLTTVRLAIGLAAAAAFTRGTYGWSNVAALLLILSNFADHTDGELARMTGKTSRFGHLYDLASDAAVTIGLFIAMGVGVAATSGLALPLPPALLGGIAGSAIALIFFLRMRIEEVRGKSATRLSSVGGFETEDVLYLLPLVTLCNGVTPFLMLASVGAPLFAIRVALDYRGVRRRLQSRAAAPTPASSDVPAGMPMASTPGGAPPPEVDRALAGRLGGFDVELLRRTFTQQGAFLHLPEFLTQEITAQLIGAVTDVKAEVNRNYLPGHKQGGSVSRHAIDRLAPCIAALYRSPALIKWLGQLAGESLQVSPSEDPHAYALYFYTRPGDHIGWHYDTSYYAGRRYTLLLGIIDESSCRLDYELHTREPGVPVVSGSVQIPPGGLVFFDGDKLRHRISPLGAGEVRVSLTFEYLTDPKMHAGWRLISNMKDAVAYFGFRQVFRRLVYRRPERT